MAFHVGVLRIVAGVLLLTCTAGAMQLLLHGSEGQNAEPRTGAFLRTLVFTVLFLDWCRGSDLVPLLLLKLSVPIAASAWFRGGSAAAATVVLPTLAAALTWVGVGPQRLDTRYPIVFSVMAFLKSTLPVEDLFAASGAGVADGFVYTVAERCWASRELPPGLAGFMVAFHDKRLAAASAAGIRDLLGFVAFLLVWMMQTQGRILREAEAAAAVQTITAGAFLLLGSAVYAAVGPLAFLVKRVRELGVLHLLLNDPDDL